MDATAGPGSPRIAAFVREFPSTTETFVLNEVCSLLEQGVDVSVLSRAPGAGPRHERVGDGELRSRIHYWEASPAAWRRALEVARLAATARGSAGALARELVLAKLRGRPLSPDSLWLSRAVASVPRFDVFHAHFGPLGVELAALQRRGRLDPAPLVTTFYGYDATSFPAAAGERCYEELFAVASRILTVSARLREQVVRLGADPAKVVVHRLGIDPSRFPLRPRRRAEGEPARLLTVARLVEKKGIEDAIDALARLHARGERFVYRIVGSGPRRESLRRMAADRGIGTLVDFTGALDQGGVVRELAAAHVFLLPSVTAADADEEGTPTAILEAMASGLPVVSTHHGGIPEMIIDGVSGVLIPERSPELLADRLHHLLRHDAEWSRLAAAARERVEAEFDVSALTRKLSRIYAELASEARAATSRS